MKWLSLLKTYEQKHSILETDEHKCPLLETDEQICLSSLIEHRRWRKLNNAVVKHLKNIKNVACLCKKCTHQQSLLHLACNFTPPLYVVRNLLEFDTFNASRIDSKRRYPLHLALEYESDVEVVKFLIESNKAAVIAQDVYGKTPLHMVVLKSAEQMERNDLQDWGDIISFIDSVEMLEIILLLCDAVPIAPFVENNNGMNALEYAIDVEADCKLVKALKETMQIEHTLQMRKNRSRSPPSHGAGACAA